MNNITPSKKFKKILLIVVLGALLISVLLGYNKISKIAVDGWSQHIEVYKNSDKIDKKLKEIFLDKKRFSTSYRYNYLFKYFAYGNFKYRSGEGALVLYPGEISSRGRTINGLESFARFFPLAASWLSSNRAVIITVHNEDINLPQILMKGLINGTNPKNLEYWGDVEDKDQRIVEAADIALALWISRDYIWNNFKASEKDQIANWLNQCINKEIVDNNWNLFPITIVKALQALGYSDEVNINYVKELYNNYKNKHYLGEGWFDDPPKGVDFYNAWSIHYSLFWLDQIDPTFDHDFIRKSHSEFVQFYKYLFSTEGFPIMGRSVCYRLAAPAPIVSSALIAPKEISTGLALRTLDVTWMHFVENNAVQNGKLTQGYYEDDLRLLDGYSGAGSCLWSLRSLIVAFYIDGLLPLMDAEEEALPVELSSFSVTNSTLNWTLKGNQTNQEIILLINKNINNSHYGLKDYNFINRSKEFILKKPFRPNNEDALYKNYQYSNKNSIIGKK
ncbi:DUF2264 domain-containing protein [Winogradskyella aurantia]|uniref:DUF2264 domain-containing protein n=1 Tax=Winogradskyella aurantia TaxID=1915063 RepID=A0A265UT92_9FLAO|nr:DUF2264 domain-containing protein [Winogradskyella aurantia]OZV68533.1 hypothetical protein CA834_08650 [Winogradskyella aurantia]